MKLASHQNATAQPKTIEDGIISDQALADFKRRVGSQLRIRNIFNEEATKDAIRKFADGIGDGNPLWRDTSYAAQSDYGSIIAPPSWLNSVFPTWVLQGLPGVHAIHISTRWDFHRPVYLDDRITPQCFFTGFDIKSNSFAGRSVIERQEARYFNQEGELVAVAHPVGFRSQRTSIRKNGKYLDLELPHPWTEEELLEIEEMVLSEEIRGANQRYWEDVEPGEALTPVVKGPLGMTDALAFCIGAAPVQIKAHGLALREYRKHPAWCFRDPETCALEPVYGVHYNRAAANACGLPYPYDAAVQRNCWQIHLLTNWMGDHGWLQSCYAEYRKFVYFSDVVRLTGKVVKKYINGEGECCVDIETRAENQRGEDVMPGTARVLLPSRENGYRPLERRLR